MRSLIWIIVAILIIGWLVGFIGYGQMVGNLIHLLIIAAVILILLALFRRV